MLSGVIQIKVHLASIGVREFSCLEVDKYEASKAVTWSSGRLCWPLRSMAALFRESAERS